MRSADAALLIIALSVAWSLYRAHRDRLVNFDLLDLLIEHGRVSRLACAFLFALGLTSWIMVRLTIDGKMSEGYLGLYGTMWVAPIVAKMFGNMPAVEPPK